jgi:hypothetical protein
MSSLYRITTINSLRGIYGQNGLIVVIRCRLDMSRYGELVNDYMINERSDIAPLPYSISILWKDIKETQVIRFK